MSGKRWLVSFVSLGLLLMSCTFGGLIATPSVATEAPATNAPATEPPTTTLPTSIKVQPQNGDMTALINKLGGKSCDENPDFTCVTLKVPLNHFDASDKDTVDVVFAIKPASGERYGMFVQAFPGGPGGEGVSTATTSFFDPSILEHFDVVFFDQRGVGLSDPLSCPKAYAADFLGYLNSVDKAGQEGYDTPAEQKAVVDEAKSFDQKCVAEIGIDPAKLSFYGTNQVAEDLESFRQAVGDEKYWLYGVSYGTAVAETYATAHADHLAGLILDGTIDLTLTGEESDFSQEKAFNDVLVATLQACDKDEACAKELGGNALSVYDTLAASVSKNPPTYEFPLPNGQKVKRIFTFNELEFTAAYQMYSLGGRMLFLRALAAAKQGDMVPMARLLYQQATLDPATGAYLGDPTFSDTMFEEVSCTDNSYYSGTTDQRVADIIQAGQASNGTVPRLDGSIYSALDCVFWPSAPKDVVRAKPLVAEGVPTFVLNATLDPATPFHEGQSVYQHLADGYHIYVEGGRHSIYGFGEDCPDSYVTNFLVKGELPPQRETVCTWDPNVIRAYEPLMPSD
ncbi:MAG TPA: alpha/beta fold hydrolase, partial [Anaerolineales bacterium]|nr:alpha/beta fold hydrolase [Anaerolineales bacterium]